MTLIRQARVAIGITILIIFYLFNFIFPWGYAQVGYTGWEFIVRLTFQVSVSAYALIIFWIVVYQFLGRATTIPFITLIGSLLLMFASAIFAITLSTVPSSTEFSTLQNIICSFFLFGVPILSMADGLIEEKTRTFTD